MKGSTEQSKDWINVLSGPKWLPSPQPFPFSTHTSFPHPFSFSTHTHLTVDQKREMIVLKSDSLFKLINN